MIFKKFALILFFIFSAAVTFAIKTKGIELGEGTTYDGKVRIFRDTDGNMVFIDDMISTPVKLSTLSEGVKIHDDLVGLANDDHLQYLNISRHEDRHTAFYNDNLIIGPDVMNHERLGDHLKDSDIHICRSASENITGGWKFLSSPEFKGDVKFSCHGEEGKVDLTFEDGESDARIRWNDSEERFEFNRKIKGEDAELESIEINDYARIPGNLYGNESQGVPTGEISDFAKIEGIQSFNLLDSTADENITGKWDFLNDVFIDGNLVTSGTITQTGGGGASPPGEDNLITVAKNGGDFTKIQDAIDATEIGDVILIYPGTYMEQISGKSGITLKGISQSDCIIRYDAQGGGYDNAALNWNGAGTFKVENLTVQNLVTYVSPAGAASVVYTTNSAVFEAYNCRFIGSDNDTISGFSSSSQTYRRCYFETQNNQPDQFYFGGTGIFSVYDSFCSPGSSVLFLIDTCTVNFMKNSFFASPATYIMQKDTGVTLYDTTINVNSVDIDGDLDVDGDVILGGSTAKEITVVGIFTIGDPDGNTGPSIRYKPETTNKFEFSNNDASLWDVNLYHGGSNLLKTDDTFSAASFKIASTEIIDSSRNILSNNITVSDDKFIGLGDAKGRIEFDDTTTDKIRFHNSDLQIGTTTFINSSREITGTKLTVDSIVINDNDIDGGGTVDITDNLNVTGTLKAALSSCSSGLPVVWNDTTNEVQVSQAECPIVFYRIDKGELQCAGEIIKNANSNIFEGIVELGYVRKHIFIQVMNLKDETDYLDYIALLVESEPEPGIVSMDEIPVKDDATGALDNVYRKLLKGDSIEYQFHVNGNVNLKAVGYYLNPVSSGERERREGFLEKRMELK
jgi:hypothetical protein